MWAFQDFAGTPMKRNWTIAGTGANHRAKPSVKNKRKAQRTARRNNRK